MGSQCYLVEDPLYIEVPNSVVLKRHSEHHISMEPREAWNPNMSAPNPLRSSKRHKFNVYLYHTGNESHSSLPYAARQAAQESSRNAIMYPRVERGKQVLMPEYNAFSDPHLQNYYRKKFAGPPAIEPCKKATLRAGSTGSRAGSRPGSARSDRSSGGLQYNVTVKTGDVRGAGTNARVFVTMYGSNGKMTKRRLTSGPDNLFTRASHNGFVVYGPDVGDIVKIDVEHDGLGEQQSWFLEEVKVECQGRSWVFPCHQWLSLQRGDGRIDRQLVPKGSTVAPPVKGNNVPTKKVYEITTYTGDKRGSGTDANVFVTIFGKKGRTPKIQLANGHDLFERGQVDLFKIKTANLDPIQKIRIEHDNSGFGPGWYLEKVIITSAGGNKSYFHCNNWLADDVGDKQVVRDLAACSDASGASANVRYIITVVTGDKLGAGTDADVYIQLFGELGETVEKRLDNARNNFEKSKTDTFPIEVPNVGPLLRIVIRHDDSGPSPAWYCEKVSISEGDNVIDFPCGRWLSTDDGDGKIQVELWPGKGLDEPTGKGVLYKVTTHTCDDRGAGTDANVYLLMYSEDDTSSGKLMLRRDVYDAFKRGRKDVFEIQAASLSPLDRIVVGHDDSGSASGWKLEKVTVECPTVGISQTFMCGKWLAKDEGDGAIERELSELLSARQQRAKQTTYEVWVQTSDERGAGTDAAVSLQLYGEKGQTEIIPLDNKSNNFERGELDKFTVEGVVVGSLYKLRVWHDDLHTASGWHLAQIQVYEPASGSKALFKCNRWLDRGEDDFEIIRELPAVTGGLYPTPLAVVQYCVTVVTGKRLGSGTDADVYLCIVGERGDTGDRWLRKAKNTINKFEKGASNEFTVEAVSLGHIGKLRVGHNNEGASPGWFCQSITIAGPDIQEGSVTFLINRWYADDEDDGAITREHFADNDGALLMTTKYKFLIKTGDKLNAGTDANVYLCLFGAKGDTGKIKLRDAIHTYNKFERARSDTFEIEREDIGKLERLIVGHDGSGASSGWYLDNVTVECAGNNIIFPCERWLSENEDDGEIEKELFPVEDTTEYLVKIPYQVTILTSEKSGAGTNANVYVQLYGSEGKGEVVYLDNKSDNFEKGQEDTFKIECQDIGALHKLRIGHDNKGTGAGWHLDHVVVQKIAKESQHQSRWSKDIVKNYFHCKQWLARDEGDGEVVRELIAVDANGKPISDVEVVNYTVKIHTSDKAGAGTDSNVFCTVWGEKGDTGERQLRKSDNINKFEKAQMDTFTVSAVDLGPLTKVKVRQDDSGGSSAWHCSHVEVQREGGQNRVFPCGKWLATDEDDGAIARELAPLSVGKTIADAESANLELAAQKTMYHVTVCTGDKTGAGTDADVFLQMFGEKDDSGEIQLKSCKSNSINKFERDSSDMFYVECINLGPIQRLQIWHDATGMGSDWYVEKVKVDAPALGIKRVYPCQEWMGESKGDGTTKKELYPAVEADEEYKKNIKWEIVVYTSDIAGAGTDANVFIVLLGDKGSSGKINLVAGNKDTNKFFEKGSIDVFTPDVPDIGTRLFKAQIGHTGRGMGDGWHVDSVVARCLDNGSTLTYTFPCGRWLDRGEGDGQIEVDLIPESAVKTTKEGEEEDVEIEKLENEVYTIKIRTGHKFGAGTDANVYLSIFGTLGDSGERKLMKSENLNKFQRNQTDTFTIDCAELGEIYKIVLKEDCTAAGADWYVAYVNISTPKDEAGIDFPCEQWFSEQKGDKQTKRALYPKGKSTDEIKMAEKAMKRGISFCVDQDGTKTNANIEVAKERTEIIYQVMIETGPDKGDGTDADAYIILNNGAEKTDELSLYHMGHHDKFKPGQKQEFEIEHENVGDLTSIILGHKGVLSEDAWFVKSISLNVPTNGKRYVFEVMRWLAKDRGDRKIAVELKPTAVHEFAKAVPHTITLHTADVDKSGTDGNLIVKFFGDNGASDDITLAKTSGRFERASITSIPIEFTDVGSLMKLRLKLIGSSRKNYFCNKILLRNLDTDIESLFETADWVTEGSTMDIAVSSPEGERLEKVDYKVDVTTSDLFACSTDANVYIKLYGELGDSIDLRLKDSKTHANKFERNNTDNFFFSMLSLGPLTHCRVWHDDSGSFSSWHLNNIAITDTSDSTVYNFPCNKWLSSRKDDKNISRDLICSNPRKVKAEAGGYEVIVVITNKKEAGTQHGLWFSVEGSTGSTDKMEVENKMGRFFKKGSSELFFFSSEQMEIGELTHIRVGLKPREGADKDKDPIKQCHLHDIIVNKRGDTTQYHFACNHWLSLPGTPGRKSYRKLGVSGTEDVDPDLPARVSASLAAGPGAAESDITTYLVSVLTGDKFGAGTDANVFITMFGKTGDTGKRALVKAGENLFERNITSVFDLECKSLEGLTKIIIEHDNAGVGASWHCDSVKITDQTTQEVWNFNCNEWLDKKKGDRQLFKVLWPVGRKTSVQRKTSMEKKSLD